MENHALINDACEARSVGDEGIVRREIYNAVSGKWFWMTGRIRTRRI